MEEVIKILESWKDEIERQMKDNEKFIETSLKQIEERQEKLRLQTERLKEIKKAIILLKAHKGASVIGV